MKRNKLFSQKLTNSNANAKYKLLKKEIDQELKHSRISYFKSKLIDNKNNLKAKWEVIKELINRKSSSNNNIPCTNEQLGNHYSSVAENLAKKIPKIKKEDIPATSSAYSSNKTHITSSFSFKNTSERERFTKI